MGNELTSKETYALWVNEYRESGDTSWLNLVIEGLQEMLYMVSTYTHCGHNINGIYHASVLNNNSQHDREVRRLCKEIEFFVLGTGPAWQTYRLTD